MRLRILLILLLLAAPCFAVQYLKQSTAATVKLGPFVDATDGVTAETAITIDQDDIRISKNGGAFAQSNNATGGTHDAKGWYGVPLDATDTGTLGRVIVAIHDPNALPVWAEFTVVRANVYDSLFADSDYLDVSTVQIEGLDATDQINTQADTALTDYGANTTTPPTVGAIRAELETAGGSIAAILADTNELQTNQGNWLTATGFMLSTEDGSSFTAVPWNATWDAQVESEVDDALGGGTGTALTAIPWNAAWDAEAQSEAADALTAYGASTHAAADVTGGTTVAAAVTALQGADSDTLETLSDQLDAVSSTAGSGSETVTITVTDGTNPIEGVAVWITTDSAGANVVAGTLYTDSSGEVDFSLDADTYYVWKQAGGYNFTNPVSITVTDE